MFNEILFTLSVSVAILSIHTFFALVVLLWVDSHGGLPVFRPETRRDTFVIAQERSLGIETRPLTFATFEFHRANITFVRFVEESELNAHMNKALAWTAQAADRWFKVTTHDGMTSRHGQKSSLLALVQPENTLDVPRSSDDLPQEKYEAALTLYKKIRNDEKAWISYYRLNRAWKTIDKTTYDYENPWLMPLRGLVRSVSGWKVDGAIMCGAKCDKVFNRRFA